MLLIGAHRLPYGWLKKQGSGKVLGEYIDAQERVQQSQIVLNAVH
jgi:hypothetical protein